LLQRVIGPRDFPEFTPIICDTGTAIEIGLSCVKKTYIGADRHSRISHLRIVYQLLRQKDVPNVDSALDLYDDSSHGAVAYLQPKGVNRQPTSPLEVLEAVLCLLEVLVVMHDAPKPLFHRDICWPNIILSPDKHSKWFLIDWDDAAISPTRAAKHLDPKSHSAATFQHNHGAEVDIWAAGKLILDAREFVPAIPDTLVNIGTQMVKGLIGTAKEAQSRIRQLTMGSFVPSIGTGVVPMTLNNKYETNIIFTNSDQHAHPPLLMLQPYSSIPPSIPITATTLQESDDEPICT